MFYMKLPVTVQVLLNFHLIVHALLNFYSTSCFIELRCIAGEWVNTCWVLLHHMILHVGLNLLVRNQCRSTHRSKSKRNIKCWIFLALRLSAALHILSFLASYASVPVWRSKNCTCYAFTNKILFKPHLNLQVGVTVNDSGLCCCTCVTYFERWLTPLRVDWFWIYLLCI